MVLFFAFILDVWIGDPEYSFHPVRLMGKGIERLEEFYRRVISNEYLAGLVLALSFPFIVYFSGIYFLKICAGIHPALAWILNMLGIYTAISIHDLRKEAIQIQDDLAKEDIAKARLDLARIVGRDTKNLDEKEIVRATVETVAESTVDGIIAPLFYAAIGGAPLALAYKAINTLDSMVGYRNERYAKLGFCSAKLDDCVNWIPSRLSYLFIILATTFTKDNINGAIQSGWIHCKKLFLISDVPEATFAGALNIQLGGANFYQGEKTDKSFLGSNSEELHQGHINKSLRLMMMSSWVTLIFCFMMGRCFG